MTETAFLRVVTAARQGRTLEALAALRAALTAAEDLPPPEVLDLLADLPEVRASADLTDLVAPAAALVGTLVGPPERRYRARAVWADLRARRPSDALVLTGQGVLEMATADCGPSRLGDPAWAEAARAFREALAVGPRLPSALFGLAAADILAGRAETGLTALRDFVRAAPDPAPLRTRWAVAWLGALGAALEGRPGAAEALTADWRPMPGAAAVAETLAGGEIHWLARRHLLVEVAWLWLRDLARSDRWERLPARRATPEPDRTEGLEIRLDPATLRRLAAEAARRGVSGGSWTKTPGTAGPSPLGRR